jgi:hypothetical protein
MNEKIVIIYNLSEKILEVRSMMYEKFKFSDFIQISDNYYFDLFFCRMILEDENGKMTKYDKLEDFPFFLDDIIIKLEETLLSAI